MVHGPHGLSKRFQGFPIEQRSSVEPPYLKRLDIKYRNSWNQKQQVEQRKQEGRQKLMEPK
jgi:hypothetical protein